MMLIRWLEKGKRGVNQKSKKQSRKGVRKEEYLQSNNEMKKSCKKNVFEKHFGTHCKCGADSSIALCGRASQRAPVGSLKSSRRPRQV